MTEVNNSAIIFIVRKAAISTEIEVLSPPNAGTRPSVSQLAVLLLPGMMITIMLCIAAFTRNAYTLMYTLTMSSVSIMMAVINYRSQKRSGCRFRNSRKINIMSIYSKKKLKLYVLRLNIFIRCLRLIPEFLNVQPSQKIESADFGRELYLIRIFLILGQGLEKLFQMQT